ncbi:MAG: sugar phosphate isomerase/epimerase family protein [Planctomycetia bacterium]|nr:sugar phosphate isomerase/epimerase family protein [Planctomycetia bacterium]
MNRRNFLAVAAAATVLSRGVFAGEAPVFKTHPKKAFLGPLPDEARIEEIMKAGFRGMEIQGSPSIAQAEAAKKIADRLGFTFHSVMGGGSEDRIELAAALGADTVLLVPGRISGIPMPKPWEFELDFDEKTGMLRKVVAGDNTPYEAYIQKHNETAVEARRLVESLMPCAEKNGVVIALENVWNNMWVKPKFAANFILSFASPLVKAYVDLGNHRQYADPKEWFTYLNDNIRRIHLKDFRLNANGQGGTWCKLGEGSVDWPVMRQEMERIGYNSWCTVEPEGGIAMTLEFQSAAADRILSGK